MAAIAVEVLRWGVCVALGSLPQLSQVGVGIAGAIARVLQRVGQRSCPAGAVTCAWLAATITRPYQAILLVVAEVLRLAASPATGSPHRCPVVRAAGTVPG